MLRYSWIKIEDHLFFMKLIQQILKVKTGYNWWSNLIIQSQDRIQIKSERTLVKKRIIRIMFFLKPIWKGIPFF